MRALAPALVASLLASCSMLPGTGSFSKIDSSSRAFTPIYEGGPWGMVEPRQQEILLAKSDFSVEIVRFTDARRARSTETAPPEALFYQYEPDTILGGVSTRVPALFDKYLAYRPQHAKHYKVELDLTNVRMNIKRGTFMSGSGGRYSIELGVVATARRPDSSVILRRAYRFADTLPRHVYVGRSPSTEMDRAQMNALAESAIRFISMNIGWDIRQTDARRWDVETPPPGSTFQATPKRRLERAAGSTHSYGPELIQEPLSLPGNTSATTRVDGDTLPPPAPYAPDSAPVDDAPLSSLDDRS